MKRKASGELDHDLKTNNSSSDQQQVVSFDDIMVMINNNQGAQVKETIENKSFEDINLKNDDSILMRASHVGDEVLVQFLLSHGADMSFESHYSGHTALSLACLHGHASVVKLLVENKADPNLPMGQVPIVLASRNGHIKIVELLLDNGADIRKLPMFVFDESHENYYEDEYASGTRYCSSPNALMTACIFGHIDLVRLLLQRGANADETLEMNEDYNNHGMTPLTFASRNGHWDIVRLLLEHGAAVDGTRDWSEVSTPLMHACATGNLQMIEALINLGADLNRTVDHLPFGKFYDSPLSSACLHGHAEVVRFILDHNKFVASENAFDLALVEAHENGSTEVLALLQSYAYNKLAADSFKGQEFLNRLLIHTCKAGRGKVAKVLLTMGAKVDAVGKSGRTSLMASCRRESSTADLIQILIEHGADVNQADPDGYTPLMTACRRKEVEIAKLLLDYGTDVTIKNNAGKDVFYLINNTECYSEACRKLRRPLYDLCEQYRESNRRDRTPDETQLK